MLANVGGFHVEKEFYGKQYTNIKCILQWISLSFNSRKAALVLLYFSLEIRWFVHNKYYYYYELSWILLALCFVPSTENDHSYEK